MVQPIKDPYLKYPGGKSRGTFGFHHGERPLITPEGKFFSLRVSSPAAAKAALGAMGQIFPLRLLEPCGESYLIESLDAFPAATVPSTCGNPNHYFVLYTDVTESRKDKPIVTGNTLKYKKG